MLHLFSVASATPQYLSCSFALVYQYIRRIELAAVIAFCLLALHLLTSFPVVSAYGTASGTLPTHTAL